MRTLKLKEGAEGHTATDSQTLSCSRLVTHSSFPLREQTQLGVDCRTGFRMESHYFILYLEVGQSWGTLGICIITGHVQRHLGSPCPLG